MVSEQSLADLAPTDRIRRGILLLLEDGDSIEPLGKGLYRVGKYTVDLGIFHDEPEHESCTCPDFVHQHETCKHLIASAVYRAKTRASERVRRRRRRPTQRPAIDVAAALERMGA